MKQLDVPVVSEELLLKSASDINAPNHFLAFQTIEAAPWKEFPYRPDVKFGISHSGNFLLLKFFVEERYLRSENKKINSSVWEDSCVEFFIRFDDAGYYNFEFNCIGTPLIGFGKEKLGRTLLPESVIEHLFIKVDHAAKTNGNVAWQLEVLIPVDVFNYHSIKTLHGIDATGNFYKCGDLTPEPHFLTWNFIDSEKPNFHLPDFFGKLHFCE